MKSICVAFSIVICALLSGCASVQMQDTALITAPKPNVAIVTFVRPSIFFGDGVAMDIWDGPHYIGSLGAGRLIQYETTPGKHLFLANAENWSYAVAELEAGRQYFIKGNVFPGIGMGRVALGAATRNEPRIEEWLTYKPGVATEKDRKEMSEKKKAEVGAAIADFESGKVTAFATLKKDDGR